MKLICTSMLFFLPVCIISAVAQESGTFPFSTLYADLKKSTGFKTETPIPFGNVTVADYRYDSTKEGFIYKKTGFYIFRIKEGAPRFLESKFQQATFRDKTKPDLMIILRAFWLRDIKSGELGGQDQADRSNVCQFIVKFDTYLVTGNDYQAIFRVDTVFTKIGYLSENADELVMNALKYSMVKLSSVDTENIKLRKNRFTQKEIFNQYNKNHIKSMNIEVAPKRGLYLSFTDFLNNTVTPIDFIIEETSMADCLYIVEKDEKKLFTNFWGFADRGQKYIRVGTNFFPLTRDDGTFSFWGCLRATHANATKSENKITRFALFGVFGELHNSRLQNLLHPLQVDMETGNVY
jgi:hypothetical protein